MSSKTPKIDWLPERPRVFFSVEALAAIREGPSLSSEYTTHAFESDAQMSAWMAGRQWGKSSVPLSFVTTPAHQPPYPMLDVRIPSAKDLLDPKWAAFSVGSLPTEPEAPEVFPLGGIFEQLDELWPPQEPEPPAEAPGPEATPKAVWQWLGPAEKVGQLKSPLPTAPVFSVGSDKAVGWVFEHTEVLIGINTRGLRKLELTK